MTLERDTRTRDAPATAHGGVDHGPDPEELRLLDWWVGLTNGWHRQLAVLEAGRPLPRSVAEALHRRGVALPLELHAEHGRLVRRTMPSPALLSFIAARRAPAPGATPPHPVGSP